MSTIQESNHNTPSRIPVLKDVFFQILGLAIETASAAASSIQKTLQELHVREMLDDALRYFSEHPFVSLCVAGLVLTCGIPIFAFFCFAVITVVMTFVGFIFIEGTLLTVGSMMLCGFLLTIVFVVLVMSSVMALCYFGCIQIANFVRNPSILVNGLLINKVAPTPVHSHQRNHTANGERRAEVLKAHNVD